MLTNSEAQEALIHAFMIHAGRLAFSPGVGDAVVGEGVGPGVGPVTERMGERAGITLCTSGCMNALATNHEHQLHLLDETRCLPKLARIAILAPHTLCVLMTLVFLEKGVINACTPKIDYFALHLV